MNKFVSVNQLIHLVVHRIAVEHVLLLDVMQFVTMKTEKEFYFILNMNYFTCSISCKARLNCFSRSTAESRDIRNRSASS